VTSAVTSIIEAAGVAIDWDTHVVGAKAIEQGESDTLPQRVLDSIVHNKVALKGPVTTPVGKGFQSVNVRLRRSLDLYANLRPVRSLPNVPSRFENVQLVVVRENTEGLYSGLEHEVVPGVVESLKILTDKASTRISKFAMEYARTHGHTMVTAVHKANILKLGDGLFLRCFEKVAEDYPEITANDRIIDNLCMQLVVRPEQFQVLVLENLYGDIVSDLVAGLVGGLGVVGGANIGESTAVFEAVHGSAPDIAGQNKANPTALLQSAILMLDHIGEREASTRIYDALVSVLAAGRSTSDIGGSETTSSFAKAICDAIEKS
jgi:isocitrate dehydrogenase (NAD+)